jgi:hypothetical protein
MTEDYAVALMRLAMAYGKAWNDADVNGILALHTADSVFQLHDGSLPAVGIDAVGVALRNFFERFSNASFVRRSVFFGSENWAIEWTLTPTPRGGAMSRSELIPVSIEGVDIVTVRDGLVAAKHVYYDGVSVAKMMAVA